MRQLPSLNDHTIESLTVTSERILHGGIHSLVDSMVCQCCGTIKKSMPDNICQLQPEKLVPIVMTPALWGHKWRGMVVQFVSDNKEVVAMLNSGYTGDGVLMHLLRCSFLLQHHSAFGTVHATSWAVAADAISRNKLVVFFHTRPLLVFSRLCQC